MTRSEEQTLRGLVHLAWADRHDPERLRRRCAVIVDWWRFGRFAGRVRRRDSGIDELVALLRRTDPDRDAQSRRAA